MAPGDAILIYQRPILSEPRIGLPQFSDVRPSGCLIDTRRVELLPQDTGGPCPIKVVTGSVVNFVRVSEKHAPYRPGQKHTARLDFLEGVTEILPQQGIEEPNSKVVVVDLDEGTGRLRCAAHDCVEAATIVQLLGLGCG